MLRSLKKRVPTAYKARIADALLRLHYALLCIFITPIEFFSRSYITIHSRPKYAKDVRLVSEAAQRDYSEYAIVVQGPLYTNFRLTLETLLLFKKNYPGAMLILSTWEGEDARTIAEAQRAGVEVLTSKILPYGGPTNINRQIYSSLSGVLHAKKAEKKYVLKIRSDQRLYAPRALSYLSDLLALFPAHPGKARGRIIGRLADRKKLYMLSDFFYFGYTEDMEVFFSAPLVEKPVRLPFLEEWRPFSNEGYMCWQYAERLGYPLATTTEDFSKLLARQFLIVDLASLDFLFHKGGYKRMRFFERAELEYGYVKDLKVDFAEWLELYVRETSSLQKSPSRLP